MRIPALIWTTFDNLGNGDVFIYEGQLYIKGPPIIPADGTNTRNATKLSNGVMVHFQDVREVAYCLDARVAVDLTTGTDS